jgi:hypothetical protein
MPFILRQFPKTEFPKWKTEDEIFVPFMLRQ